ncbi:hypothetical protein D3C72_1257040 [compost metagenome]
MSGILNPKSKQKSAPRLHPSIKKEAVNPSDFMKYDTRFSCEDCSHFDSDKIVCTIGYNPQHHLKAEQTKQYELSGTMAFCRFIEID